MHARRRIQISAIALATAATAGSLAAVTSFDDAPPKRASAVAAADASAAAATYKRSYTVVQQYWSKPLKRCMIVTLWGTVSYTIGSENSRHKTYRNRAISQPTMRLTVRTKCGSGGKNVKASKAKIRQRWWESACRHEPSVGGGIPWTVAFAVTFDCGQFKTASRSTGYGKHHTYTQYNSSTKVKWSGTSSAWTHNPYETKGRWWPLCLSSSTTATIWKGNKSDTWPSGKFKVCVRHK